jgi:serine/threonine protein kinase
MEYCLSTVNEFLNDIRAFQRRAHTRQSSSGLWSDLSDLDDDSHHDALRVAPSLDVNELVRGFVKQLLQALLALDEHSIVHCDVKGDNIFIANENGHHIVKLGVSSSTVPRHVCTVLSVGFQSIPSFGTGVTIVGE